jgi:hypothetical protein
MRTGVFREDGAVLKVQIVADDSDEEWIRYDLKVLKVFAQSPYGPSNEGEEFSVSHRRNAGCFSGMWHLTEDKADA